MQVRTASIGERAALSALAFRSKAHWGYDAEFMEKVREGLMVPEEHLQAGYVHVLEDGGETAGFFSFIPVDEQWELDFVFIDPPVIGKGYGRALWDAVLQEAKRRGVTEFTVTADPYAEGFYLKMGAVRVSEFHSTVIPGRTIPILKATVQ